MARFKTYAELVRPFTLIAPLVGLVSGAVMAAGGIPQAPVILAGAAAVTLNSASNIINQIFDIDIDRINKPGRPLPRGKLSVREAALFAALLYGSTLIMAWGVNSIFFLIVLLTAIMTFFYSAPPLRFKKRIFLSNATIATTRGLLLTVAGWSTVRPPTEVLPWFVGSVFALYIAGAASTKDFSDLPGDLKFGVKTLPAVYGVEKAAHLIAPFFYLPFLLIPAGILAGIVADTAYPLAALSIWGFFTARMITSHPDEMTLERNHVSWKHMYLILITGQAGFAMVYIIK